MWNEISCTKLHLPPEPLTRGLHPQIPILSVLCPQMNLLKPPQKKNSWVRHCTKQKVKNGVKNRTDIFKFDGRRPEFVNSKLCSNKTVVMCNMKGEEFHLGPPCSHATEWCLLQTENAHFYNKTNQLHQCIKLFYFEMTLYRFWTVFPSIIKSSRLYIEQQAYVKQILLSAC